VKNGLKLKVKLSSNTFFVKIYFSRTLQSENTF
jgi:hypothetical protein